MRAVQWFTLLCLQSLVLCWMGESDETAPTTVIIDQLYGYPGEGYSLSIAIGTPPQEFKVILDTGSSNFAIAAAQHKNATSYFLRSQSTTYQSLDKTASVEYTEGFWSGSLGRDVFSLSGVTERSVLVDLVCIENSRDFFQTGANWQGILGLAYASLAKPDSSVTPVFKDMLQQRTVSENIFSMQLCGTVDRNHSYDVSVGGKLVLDGVASELYRGDILYTPIVKEWFYEVELTDIAVDGTSLDMDCKEYNTPKTIVDSGTTSLRLPTAVYNKLLEMLKRKYRNKVCGKSAEFWKSSVSCCWSPVDGSQFKAFPNISLSLSLAGNSSQQFTLVVPPQLYLQAVNNTADDQMNAKDCYKFSIFPSSSGTVLGAIVMEGYYVVFDRTNRQVGFAQSTCEVRAAEFAKPVVKGPMKAKNTSCRYQAPSKNKLSTMSIILIILSLVIILPVTFCLVVTCSRSRNSSGDLSVHAEDWTDSSAANSSDERHLI